MDQYRFVGMECQIGENIKLERFGQQVRLSDEVAKIAVLGGAGILPEAIFDGLGFTEQEVSLYAWPGQRMGAPEVVVQKIRAAHAALHEYRASVEGVA